MLVLITKVWLSQLNYDVGYKYTKLFVTITKLFVVLTEKAKSYLTQCTANPIQDR